MPATIRRHVLNAVKAPYGVTGVNAGTPSAVHPVTLATCTVSRSLRSMAKRTSACSGSPTWGPYNVNSIMNPVLAMCMALGYLFNFYLNKPIVRQGGVGIFHHPLPNAFHPVHHPSYIDFFEEVLSVTTDPAQMEAKFEAEFAQDPWYIHLYRNSYAFHGVHPFYMWYWGAHAMQHLGDIIFVGADPKTAARLGFRSAPDLSSALEIASDTVGSVRASPVCTRRPSPWQTYGEPLGHGRCATVFHGLGPDGPGQDSASRRCTGLCSPLICGCAPAPGSKAGRTWSR